MDKTDERGEEKLNGRLTIVGYVILYDAVYGWAFYMVLN